MDVIGPIGSLITAGMELMNRYEHCKRNKKLFETYIQIIKLWEKELGKENLKQIIEETDEVQCIVDQCTTMIKQLKRKFISFKKKNMFSKFFKAKKINDDIDAFTNGMQNLMDILSFKINVKNSEKLNEVNDRLELISQQLGSLKIESSDTRMQLLAQTDGIQQVMQDFAIKVQSSTEAYRSLEYHCRYPGRGIRLKDAELDFQGEIEEEKKTGCSDSEKEVRLSDSGDSSDSLDSIFTIETFKFMTIRVVYSDDGNFEEDEYFKFEGRQCLHSDKTNSKKELNRKWDDEYTAVKFGRFRYSQTEENKILNDISFDSEVEDQDTGEISVGDKNVSKEHATILFDKGRYIIADLGSVNSTFIKVNKLVLREGIVFDLGKDNLFVVHCVLNPQCPETLHNYESDTLDPYNHFVDGRLIFEEFRNLNAQNYFGQSQNSSSKSGFGDLFGSLARIELRSLKNSSEIITIMQEEIAKKGSIVIGRGADADIIVQGDAEISRRHCSISLSEHGDWVLDSEGHDVFWSLRLESEWPEMRFDFEEVFGGMSYEEFKKYPRPASIPVVLRNLMQVRISDTLFELEFH
ncbi:unnamed protein product [Moneuplotes crassus]|uniref:FHA domain-containing protein n=1 Tax=Euplotes crassus TaxID=5936 RepID=A0AAD1UBA4_EUPCR|nr:unnamed protein product [Moneuplotes crassus]